jgi:hypothetical protein
MIFLVPVIVTLIENMKVGITFSLKSMGSGLIEPDGKLGKCILLHTPPSPGLSATQYLKQ